ncbi:MAG: hypothetical protein IIB95_11830 [Candidatus Marinimicrobia bacterium]|nr:hypothetical protein [Candidatus Neomarinimicrobiota bacterium]
MGEKVSDVYKKMLYLWSKESKNNVIISYIYWENGFPEKIELNDNYFQPIYLRDAYVVKVALPMAK